VGGVRPRCGQLATKGDATQEWTPDFLGIRGSMTTIALVVKVSTIANELTGVDKTTAARAELSQQRDVRVWLEGHHGSRG